MPWRVAHRVVQTHPPFPVQFPSAKVTEFQPAREARFVRRPAAHLAKHHELTPRVLGWVKKKGSVLKGRVLCCVGTLGIYYFYRIHRTTTGKKYVVFDLVNPQGRT